MKCQAKVHVSMHGCILHYSCECPAEFSVKTVTFASHINRDVIKVRNLCPEHRKRLVAKIRYKVKHCGKKTTIIETRV